MPVVTLPEMAPDVVALLSDGRRCELWMNPLSGDDCEWEVIVDGAVQPSVTTGWPYTREEGEACARSALAFLGLPVVSLEVL